jgi:hypothetical protein
MQLMISSSYPQSKVVYYIVLIQCGQLFSTTRKRLCDRAGREAALIDFSAVRSWRTKRCSGIDTSRDGLDDEFPEKSAAQLIGNAAACSAARRVG